MPGNDERIETYVNRSGVQSDTEFMLQQFNAINDGFDKVNGLKLTLGKDNSFKAATDSANGLKKATDDVSLSVQAFAKVNNDNATIQAKLSASTSDAAKANAELKIQLQQATAANKSAAQEALGMVDAYGKLKQQYTETANAAKNLQTIAQASGNTSDQAAADAATTKAKALHDQLLSIEQAVGQSQRNVGNYTGALKVLESSLADVNGKMAQVAASGQQDTEAYQQLAQEAALLNILVGEQSAGFSSVTQEIRNSERALQTIRATLGEGSEAFQQLRQSTIAANQEQKEFQRQQKLLEGEAPALQGLIIAAKGLGGAYAIGQGAATLFADGNQKVAEQLNKLVAIMTILQGLNEANTLLNQAGAISQGVRNGLTKASTVLLGENAAVTEAVIAANYQAAAAADAAGLATGEEAVALQAEAVAAAEAAAATEAAALASAKAATAFAATGIGAAILVIGAAIVYLLAKIPDWIKGNELTIKQQGELADAIKNANAAIIDQAKSIETLDSSTKRYYQNQLTLLQASGANEEKTFALRKSITGQEIQLAQEQIDALGATNKQQSALASTLDLLNDKRQAAINIQKQLLAVPEQNQTSDQKDQLKAAIANTEFYGKQAEAIKGLYDAGQKARADLFAANLKADQDDIEEQKLSNAERAKLVLAEANLEADATQAKNALILSNDKSTLAQRLAATISNASAQRKIIESANENVQTDPGASKNDKIIAAQKAAEEETKLTDSTQRALYDLRESYRLRDLAAEQEINEAKLNESIKSDQAIFQNEDKSLSERLAAFRQFNADQQALLDSQKNTKLLAAGFSQQEIDNFNAGLAVQIEDKKITYEELKALQIKYNTESASLTASGAKQVYDIALSNGKKQFEDLKTLNKLNLDTSNVDQYNQDVHALNTAYEHKLIGVGNYQAKKKKLDDAFNISQLQDEVAADQKSLDQDKAADAQKLAEIQAAGQNLINAQETGSQSDIDQNQAVLDALLKDEKDNAALILAVRKKLQDDTKKLQDIGLAEQQAHDTAILQAEAQLAKKILSGIQTVVDARYDNEKAQIQSTIDAINAKAQTDIAAENASSDSAQDKADKIEVINERAAAQNAQLAQEQKKIDHDKAVFDKEIAILNVVINTAVAISNALKTPFLIPIIAATGAVEIATIAATPIPSYKLGAGVNGRPKHPGGPAEVGHGKHELAITPAGEMIYTPSVPTTMNFPKDTVVLPDADAAIDALIYSSFRGLDRIEAPAPDSGLLKATNQLIKENRRLQQIVANKPVERLNVSWQGMEKAYRAGQYWFKYIDEKTNW